MSAITTSGAADAGASPSRLSDHVALDAGTRAPGVTRDIVVVGASAGGVDTLKALVAAMPADYPGSVFVVLHIPPSVPSVLTTILRRVARLRCVTATDEAPVEPGTIYVAPPNFHLLLEPGRIRLSPGPRENGHRPAVDPLFRSAATAYSARTVGVVLTGNLDDGTRGLLAIVERGGLAVVQDPDDADFTGMPLSAIANVAVQHVLPAHAIGALLAMLATPPASASADSTPANDVPSDATTSTGAVPSDAVPIARTPDTLPPSTRPPASNLSEVLPMMPHDAARSPDAPPDTSTPMTDHLVERVADVATGIGVVDGGARINESLGGTLSAFTCPECRGALWELRDGELVRYRCRVGHAYTDQGLVDNKARAVEDALWTALTALEESAAIAARVSERAHIQGREQTAATFRDRAEFLERRGTVLRDVLNALPGHVDGV